MSVLVLDVGSSSFRASAVRPDGTIAATRTGPVSLDRPGVGWAEFDAAELAAAAIEAGRAVAEADGAVSVVGVTAQRASTVVWERSSGMPVAPALSWQDIRTAGACVALSGRGIHVAPSQSATKLAYLLDHNDPERCRDLCFGTLECYLAYRLSEGAAHVTDASNAALTGLVDADADDWDAAVLEALGVPRPIMPAIVDSSGLVATCSALPGAPPLGGLVGDQQASLVGQGCLLAGEAKVTFGTGAMLDCVTGARPDFAVRGEAGTYPVVAWRARGEVVWGVEGAMLAAGACVDWLQAGLGLISDVSESDALAASAQDSGGVFFVPALGGLGTPVWDFGARGLLSGLSASTTRAEVVRAVLEGIAERGVDLVEAAEADTSASIGELRVDGGMTANATFLQLLADAVRRPIVPAEVVEATTLGAAFLAGTADGTWADLAEAASTARSGRPYEPHATLDRARWLEAREHACHAVPAMSAISF